MRETRCPQFFTDRRIVTNKISMNQFNESQENKDNRNVKFLKNFLNFINYLCSILPGNNLWSYVILRKEKVEKESSCGKILFFGCR